MNCIVGRTAGRNAPGGIVVDGENYPLPGNDGGGGGINPKTNLHGGMHWNRITWEITAHGDNFVTLEHEEEEGPFPGKLWCAVTYTVTDAGEFCIRYEAECSKATPVSFTNHCYYNLSSGKSDTMLGHTLQIDADEISRTPLKGDGLPNGERIDLEGSGLDLRETKSLDTIVRAQAEGHSKDCPKDCREHNPKWPHGEEYVLKANIGKDWNKCQPSKVATLSHDGSGRVMDIYTTEPCIQTYYSTLLEDCGKGAHKCKGLKVYGKNAGVCLETQRFANAESHDSIPSRILHPGQVYKHTTVHRFRTTGPSPWPWIGYGHTSPFVERPHGPDAHWEGDRKLRPW